MSIWRVEEQTCPQNPHLPDSGVSPVEGGGHSFMCVLSCPVESFPLSWLTYPDVGRGKALSGISFQGDRGSLHAVVHHESGKQEPEP